MYKNSDKLGIQVLIVSMNIFTSAYFKKNFVIIVNFVRTEYDWMGINRNIHEMDEIRLNKFLVSIHKILPHILNLP